MQIRYSTFRHIEDNQSKRQENTWAELTNKFLTHTVAADKEGVELFCAATFGRSGRREKSNVEEVSFFVLDFDNSDQEESKIQTKAQGVKVKVMVPVPVQLSEIEALLAGYEFVITSTHNHTTAWPRFRVLMPLSSPVQLTVWDTFVSQATEQLGLDVVIDCLDPCYKSISQMYYWPSVAAGRVLYAKHHTGTYMSFDEAMAPLVQTKRSAGAAQNFTPFTLDQISAYWAQEDPNVIQDPVADEWRYNCDIHGGDSFKLYVNANTGFWCCQSGCNQQGGDIYEYHKRKNKLSFPQAKEAVHKIIGTPAANYAPEQLTEIIQDSELGQVNQLVQAISKHAAKVRTQLKNQLITRHPQLNKEDINESIKHHSKVVEFVRNGEPVLDIIPEIPDEYGLKLANNRYQINDLGVFEMGYSRDGKDLITMTPPVSDRPIWPSAIGLDLKTDTTYLQLSWIGSKGRHHQEWCTEGVLRSAAELCKLDDAPISLNSLRSVSAYLVYAKTTMDDSVMQELASSTGWYGDDIETQRFVMPGDPKIGYVGPRLTTRGTVEGWAEGLKAILDMGQDGYRALAMSAFSAASPLIQLVKKRSPIIGLIHDSSSGKGGSIVLGVAIYDAPHTLTVSALSTAKGGQDRMTGRNGLPVFYDEMQQTYKTYGPAGVEAILYGQANNLSRVTSGVGRKTTGGDERFHTTLFAAEKDVMYALQGGAQNRTICLAGTTPPLGNEDIARIVERSAVHNYGVVGRRIVDIINEDPLSSMAELEYTADKIYTRTAGLKGNDHYSIAMATMGLNMLEMITGIPIPVDDFQSWLIGQIKFNRAHAKHGPEEALVSLIEMLNGMPWDRGNKDALEDLMGGIAFRDTQLCCADPLKPQFPLEINPSHTIILQFLAARGLQPNVAEEWATKGWLQKQNRHLKWDRNATKNKVFPGARVWRITAAGMDLMNMAGGAPVATDEVPENVE